MKTMNIALGVALAAGAPAAIPSTVAAQYQGNQQNSALAEQRKQIKDAEAEVAKIRTEMNKIKAKLQTKFESKEEWDTAKKNLKDAEAQYEADRKKAAAKLYATPAYKAAKAKQLKAEESVQALNGDPKANPKDLDKAQQDRLDAGLALRKLETDATAADPKLVEDKQKLADAKKANEALQDELKEALKQDPDYVAAETQLQTAQAQVDQLKQSMAQTAASERQARNQAAESQRRSRSPSGGGGYGGGGYGGRR